MFHKGWSSFRLSHEYFLHENSSIYFQQLDLTLKSDHDEPCSKGVLFIKGMQAVGRPVFFSSFPERAKRKTPMVSRMPDSMKVKDIGEFGLIGRIASALPPPPSHVVVGVGDDVAVLDGLNGDYLLATVDAQVEGVHFRLETTTPYDLGKKVVAINVSDVAAMGGAPLWALVSLILPAGTQVEFVDELYRGMGEEIQKSGGSIVGGNVSKGHSSVAIDFCLLGSVPKDRVLLRRGAEKGDMIMVTGTLGDSRAGLELLIQDHLDVSRENRARVLERHLTPRPRLREGQKLAQLKKVTAMLDVSDGLLGDLQHLCDASGVGAEIHLEKVPVSAACEEVARAAGADPLMWALTGGEDYELLFTVPAHCVEEVQRALFASTGTLCHPVGVVGAGEDGIQLKDKNGKILSPSHGAKGWDHFGSF